MVYDDTRIKPMLEKLWRCEEDDIDERASIEEEIRELIDSEPEVAESPISIQGSSTERMHHCPLYHVCATRCSFETVTSVHQACPRFASQKIYMLQSLPIHAACEAGCDVRTIKYLADSHPEGLEETDEHDNTALQLALMHHPDRQLLLYILQTPHILRDLTFHSSRESSFPFDVLDTLIDLRGFRDIALESLPPKQGNQDQIVFLSRYFHFYYAPPHEQTLHFTLHQRRPPLQELFTALSDYRKPLVSINLKFFETLPIDDILQNQALQALFLQKGSPEGLPELFQGLAVNPHFVRLHLRSMKRLAGVSLPELALLQNLRHLDLGYNKMGPSLAEPLAELLDRTRSLVDLDIGGNDVGQEGMAQVMKALATNKTLRSFRLVGESYDGLIDLLAHENMSLTEVFLGSDQQETIEYWCTVNRCGRGRLRDERFLKEDLVDLLLLENGRVMRSAGVIYGLLRTNPAVWSR